ncbi:MAG TPA: aspartate carbamoyltransferase catalytic subunit [Candidatus Limnocylindrales bacterium]|jgi:aspartate carbamoyltransferase catalytic subunit
MSPAGGAPASATARPASPRWRQRHLLDVDSLDWDDLRQLMAVADDFATATRDPASKLDVLRGVNVTILFYEASTRTRVSFEVAAKKLGADVVSVTASGSSVTKGESLIDTVRTLAATGTRMLVMRHATSGAPYLVPGIFGGNVINGGDGWHAHPTQALLDLYTLRQVLPALDAGAADGWSLRGRKVAIVGDLLHSRVARSNVWTLTAAGADLWVCAPGPLLRGFEAWAAAGAAGRRFTATTDVDAALRDADVVMTLRIQKERMAGGLLPSLAEYAATYGITRERLAAASPEVLVMHPGPMNEGVEIAPDVADGPGSLITSQVHNGVAVRMAVLSLLHAAEAGAEGPG